MQKLTKTIGKILGLVLVCVTISVQQATAQVQKGDMSLAASFSLTTQTGVEQSSGNAMLSLNTGIYLSDNFELGGLLLLTTSLAKDAQGSLGIGGYVSYNFLSESGKTLPFIGAQVFTMNTIGGPDNMSEQPALVSLGLNGGIKFFATEYVYVNTRLDWGTMISPKEAKGGNLRLQVGIGFIFPRG